jgi:hypothetical protein
VQAKVNQVLRRLPKDADPPVVAKVETNTQPMMWLALQGDRTQQQLNQYAANVVKKRLETIDGVGEVRLGGRRDRTIRVNLLPARMAAFGVTAQDINEAFAKEHVQLAGGFVVGQATESAGQARPRIPPHRRPRRHDPRLQGRRADPPRRRRRGRGRPRRQPPAGPLQRRDHRRPRHRQGRQHQHRRHHRAVKARLENEIRPQLPPGMRITSSPTTPSSSWRSSIR